MEENNFYSNYNESEKVGSTTNVKSITETEVKAAFIQSYLWMFVGVLITFLVGLASTKVLERVIDTENTSALLAILIASIVIFVAEIVLCIIINKQSLVKANFGKALAGFLIFSILNGMSFAFLFYYFAIDVLYYVFGGVALYFMVLTLISYLLRNVIEKAAGFAKVGLISLLVCSIAVSLFGIFFIGTGERTFFALYLAVSILGLVVFTILTLVDVKKMYSLIEGAPNRRSASIAAAFTLYLDFINIVVYVLRILAILGKGNRR